MESSRFDTSKKLFIFGMLSLCISLCMLFFAFYIGPHLLFGWRYGVPDFINSWIYIFTYHYNYSESGARFLIFCIFFVPGILLGVVAYIISNRIDEKIYGIEREKMHFEITPKMKADFKDSASFSLRLLMLLLLVVVVILFLGWVIAPSAT